MPNGRLAVYKLSDDADAASHAADLLADNEVCDDWVAVAYDVTALPTQPQSSWRFVGGAVVSVPAHMPTINPIDQIRAIEAQPAVSDAFIRATRQLLLGTWFAKVKAMPSAASLNNAQIEAWCRANDPIYKTLAEAEDSIKPLRGQP